MNESDDFDLQDFDVGTSVSDVEVEPARANERTLPGISFSATLRGSITSWTYTIPHRLIRKWRRQKRMALRKRRGRGAGSS